MKKELFNEEFDDEFKYPLYANALENEGLLGYYKEYKYDSNTITVTARGNIGYATVRKNKFNAIGRLIMLTAKDDLNMDFFTEYINSNVKVHIESTGVPQLTAPSLKINKLNYPNLNEQNKISDFLIMINKKIELLEKKHQYYQNFKKYLMQQIFTQKLRFSNEDWDSEKLGKLCKITMGQSPSSKNYSEDSKDTVLIQGNADIVGGKIVPRVYTSQITKTSKSGDIILTVRAPVGDLAINDFYACIGRGVCSIEGDKFIYYSLQSLKEKHVWERYSQGSTFESINSNDLTNLKVNLPSQFEQKKIVSILSNVDNKIELLHQNINDVKKFKDGLLQQMFI